MHLWYRVGKISENDVDLNLETFVKIFVYFWRMFMKSNQQKYIKISGN